MNNTTFGDETVGYYETVAGGAGAVSVEGGKGGWRGRGNFPLYCCVIVVCVGVVTRVLVGMVAAVSTPT